jgi:carbon monoxide dehydrogenase subunit G
VHLEHSFSVSAGVEQTWQVLLDAERIAGCIPGAVVDSVEDDVVAGAVKIRLGSLGPTYRGHARVVEKDDDGHRAVVELQADSRALGSANATLIVTLSEFDGATNVMIMSEVDLTGRGGDLDPKVISDAGDRMTKQVATRLAELMAGDAPAEPAPAAPAAPAEPQAAAPEAPAEEPPENPPPDDQPPTAPPAASDEAPSEAPPPVPAEEAPATPPRRRPSPYPRSATDDAQPVTTADDRSDQRDVSRSGQGTARRFAIPLGVVVVLLLLRRRRKRRR